MPSLKVLRSTDVSVLRIVGSVQLTSARGHLFALAGETLVELSTGLEIIGRRELRASETAVGPGGELLTPVGLEASGGRGDYVPDARASASCTPSWAGAYPLLACAVDMNGIRIARLAPR